MNDLNTVMETAGSTGGVVFGVLFYVLIAIALWKVFSKAGRAGILAWIPIVNAIVLLRIVGYSGWLVLLYLIPVVNFVFGIFVAFRLGSAFGKGSVFSFFLLWIFPVIGYFVLGFGQARYTRP